MFDPRNLDVEKLQKPSNRLDLYVPKSNKDKLLYKLARELKTNYLYLDDMSRDYDVIWRKIHGYFYSDSINLFYTMDETHGLLGFINVIPGRSCSMLFKMWDTDIWGAKIAREVKGLVGLVQGSFNLRRIETQSADPRIVKMSKIAGFKLEGTKRKAFKWDGEWYDLYNMATLREE